MLAWNAVVPPVFEGPALSFVQAWLLLVVAAIFGGFFRARTATASK
jgi:hypothetical protein